MAARRIAALAVVLTLLLSLSAGVAGADSREDDVRRIAKQLQCPVCQGASVADSPSDLATQMRGVIHRKLEQGEDEVEILRFFVERYGEGVLFTPPRRGLGLAVWLGPGLVLAVGGGVLFLLVRTWLRHRTEPTSPTSVPLVGHRNGTVGGAPPAPYDARVRAELDRFRRES